MHSLVTGLVVAIFAGAAHLSSAQERQPVQSCRDVSQHHAAEGTTCVTSVDAVFVRYRHPQSGEFGWLDARSQTVWYDATTVTVRNNSHAFCNAKPDQLVPTIAKFKSSLSNGIREIVRDLKDNNWVLQGERCAYGKGSSGRIGYYLMFCYEISKIEEFGVRCVSGNRGI